MVWSEASGTWTAFGAGLPYQPAGVTYSATAKATFIWKSTCGGDAVMRLNDG
jgi:hypothetical protein